MSRDRLDDAHGKGRDLFVVTSVLGVATVAAVGVASYFTFVRGDAKPRTKPVDVAIGPTGVAVSGRWP